MITFFLLFVIAPKESLQKLAIQYELLDPKEINLVFVSNYYLESDFKLVMRRYLDLYDAPPLSDCNRFKNNDTTNIINFNRHYCSYVTNQNCNIKVDKVWFDETIRETNQLFEIWDLVRDVNCPYYYVTVKRAALKKLKITLGDDAYYSGALPPCVPIWRFQRF